MMAWGEVLVVKLYSVVGGMIEVVIMGVGKVKVGILRVDIKGLKVSRCLIMDFFKLMDNDGKTWGVV